MKKDDLIDIYLKLDKPYGIGYNISYSDEVFKSLNEYQEICKN